MQSHSLSHGPKYVVGEPDVPEGQAFQIDAFDPRASAEAHLVGIDKWVDKDRLRDRPETQAEKQARLKAKDQEEKERARREAEQLAIQEKEAKDSARRDKELARQVFLAGETERRSFAQRLRENYLARGSDVKVRVSGSHAERLTLQYPLINDVWVYQFQHSEDVISALREKGFVSLTLTDGFDYSTRITF